LSPPISGGDQEGAKIHLSSPSQFLEKNKREAGFYNPNFLGDTQRGLSTHPKTLAMRNPKRLSAMRTKIEIAFP
jgi:hypothetical protein